MDIVTLIAWTAGRGLGKGIESALDDYDRAQFKRKHAQRLIDERCRELDNAQRTIQGAAVSDPWWRNSRPSLPDPIDDNGLTCLEYVCPACDLKTHHAPVVERVHTQRINGEEKEHVQFDGKYYKCCNCGKKASLNEEWKCPVCEAGTMYAKYDTITKLEEICTYCDYREDSFVESFRKHFFGE